MCVSAPEEGGMSRSAPAGRHEEADEGDAEADDEVPSADAGDRICHTAQVEDEYPHEAREHQPDHDGLEPDGIGGRFALASLDEVFVFARTCHNAQSTVRLR